MRTQSFLEQFTLEAAGENKYALRFPYPFGGSALCAAALAASKSAQGKALHSLHSYFLRPMPAGKDFSLTVEPLRDGGLLAHRHVAISDGERVLLSVNASFNQKPPENSVIYQEAEFGAPPQPETLESWHKIMQRQRDTARWVVIIDWRCIGEPWVYGRGGAPSTFEAWVRPIVPLPDDPAWHEGALLYLSDNHSDWSVAQQIPGFSRDRYSTLDTAVWAHLPLRWDDWLFVRSTSEIGANNFLFSRRWVFTRDGRLMATMIQEGLFR